MPPGTGWGGRGEGYGGQGEARDGARGRDGARVGMARGSGFVSRLGSGARHLERLEAPVGVEDGHERYVVVLLPPLHGVERGGDGRVVAHVDEQRRGKEAFAARPPDVGCMLLLGLSWGFPAGTFCGMEFGIDS